MSRRELIIRVILCVVVVAAFIVTVALCGHGVPM